MQIIDEQPPKPRSARTIVGLVFLTLGVLLFVDRLDAIPFPWVRYVFTWQSLLIGIGLICLIRGESRTTGWVLILLGGLFLVLKIFGFPVSLQHFFWPVVFLGIGLALVLSRRGPKHSAKFWRTGVLTADAIDDKVIFGASDQQIVSRNFQGGSIANIFGGSTYNLTDAELAPGKQILDLFCLFGGSKIIVPPHWNVKIEVTAIFGGYADKRRKAMVAEGSQEPSLLLLRGIVIFGGGELKSP